MTVQTTDKDIFQTGAPDEVHPRLRSFPVAASTKLYAGQIIGIDSSGNAGSAEGATFTMVVGVCLKQVDNSAGGAAAAQVLVQRGSFGGFSTSGTTIDKSKVGQKVYAADGSTLTLTSTSNALAGVVDDVKDSKVSYLIGVYSLGA